MSDIFYQSLFLFIAIGFLFYDSYRRSRRRGVPLDVLFASSVLLFELLMVYLMVSSFLD